MKIRMKDFLCYADSTFDFGNNGVALLSGPSGVGKTSILRGIFFALFGEGNKLQACGSTSCRVELDFDDLRIIRTKRPNRLVVNEVYEDESAQEIINKTFGDTFKVTGYIQQNNLNSFILMSPLEKLAFLEKFAFRDVDLGKIKSKCKAYILQTSDALVGVVSQLGMAKNVLEEMKEPIEKKFPLKCKKSEREKAIKNETIRLKNCTTLISRTERDFKKISEELTDLRVLEATLTARKEALFNFDNNLLEINKEINDLGYDGDDVLESLEKSLIGVLAFRELHVLEKQISSDKAQLEEMRLEEESVMNNTLLKYENELWKEYSKDELSSTIDDLKKCISDLVRIKSLSEELKKIGEIKNFENNKSELEVKENELDKKQHLYDKLYLQKGLYSCPSCCSKIRLVDNKLVLAKDENEEIKIDLKVLKEEICLLKQSITTLKKNIQIDENNIERKLSVQNEINNLCGSYEELPSLESVKEDLEYLYEYQTTQNEIIKKKKELEIAIKEKKFSSSYFNFKKSLEKLEARRNSLQNKCESTNSIINEEELRQQINTQKQKKDKLSVLEKRSLETTESILKCKKVLENVLTDHEKKYDSIQTVDSLENKIVELEKNISELNKKKKICEKNLYDIEEWEKYQSDLNNYKGWKTKVKELELAEKIAQNEHASATKLKDKILEAESIAMLNIIDSINSHARIYLDCFFPDNPISVNLQTFKETKKSTKPQINIEIEYKGMEADIHMLSGGELSRVILAYTMALAEMFNTPLLLLDECTSSLDQELTETVFNSIRENFNGKITLLIAHQVVMGTFDKIINLGLKE
jgi:exonuclease SbcC